MKNSIKAILTVLLIVNCKLLIAQVGINDDNSSPDASAMLDVKSTSKGILIPRMTTTQRDNISSPTTGLMIYNATTNKFNYHNGTAWIVIGEDNLGNHSATQIVYLNDNALRIRNDQFHALRYVGATSKFANVNPDGPVLHGYAGGMLGTTEGSEKIALKWDKDGNVKINEAYTLPTADGTNGQYMKTDGSGNLSWGTVSGDNLGNHTATTNLQIGTNYISNDGGSEGISIAANGEMTVTASNLWWRAAIFKSNFNGSNFIEVNNKANTRAIFGADGSNLAGGPPNDVVVGNWSNGALKLYTNGTKRLDISNTGLFNIAGTLKVVDGNEGLGKILVSDANGQAAWTLPGEVSTSHDTTQPTPIKYRGYLLYVHPTDNATNLNWATAKTTCDNLTAFGKSDWYLPTRTELNAMYKQSYLISGLSETEIIKYWSSTGKDTDNAYTQRLDYGAPDPDAKTDTNGHNCRCVRKD